IAALLTPVLLVLLCITVIGIAAIPFVAFGLICVGLFGKAVMLAWLGGRIAGRSGVGAIGHPAVAVLIGGVLVLILYVVPVLGFLVYKVLGFLGLGAVVYTVILDSQAIRAAKSAPASASPQTAAPLNSEAPAFTAAATATATAPAPAAAADAAADAAPAAAAPEAPAAAAPAAAAATSSVSAALPRAGFLTRMAALLIDVLLVGVLLHLLGSHHLELLVLAAYGAVMWKLRGSTVGGIVFDLRVVRLDGRAVDWETAIIRALSCFLSLAVAGLGFFWIAIDDNSQAWHDKIAGTVVVRVPKGVPLV
ncbi:MAG TPA: RDD family protein, partial [Steroidobacteraceae bacterium]|nr:RDD family protein [Steroidobacteraceae bacterium]